MLTQSVNLNNQITSYHYGYDANGNLTQTPAAQGYTNNFSYDLENRLVSAPGGNYSYNPANQRVWRFTTANGYDEYAVYGLDGHRLTTYKITFTPPTVETPAYATVTAVDNSVYNAFRLIAHGPGALISAVATDNIGSARQDLSLYPFSTASNFFPWGEEQTSTTNDRVKFATYRRDSESNLDYAWNRSYNNTIARFMSPDPYPASAQPSNPQSWNRYAYVLNDPIGMNDPAGLIIPAPGNGEADWLWVTAVGYLGPVGVGFWGGGGGLGGRPTVIDQNGAPGALNYELNHLSSHCLKVLPALSTLKSDAEDLQYWDARVYSNLPVWQIPGAVPTTASQTLGSAVSGANASILWGPPASQGGPLTISNQVVLGAGFFNEDPSRQGITLLHELLHHALQQDDQSIDKTYGIQLQTGDTFSSAFSAWLANDCNNPKGN